MTAAALDPIDILIELAESCDRSQDAGFWILISAAVHLDPTYDWSRDHDGSSAAILFWNGVN